MTMAFFRQDPDTSFDFTEQTAWDRTAGTADPVERPVPFISGKLAVPEISEIYSRKWLAGVLEKSSRNAAATIMIGRTGTGKTAAAAEFVRNRANVAWYSVDALDGDWNTFQNYFRAAAFRDSDSAESLSKLHYPSCDSPLTLFADVTAGLELRYKRWPTMLVLDGIHHLFDRPWFHDFFDQLVASTPADSHTLMLSRSKPPTPIWRMRSKQVLNVVDEKLLAFSEAETREYFATLGLTGDEAAAAHSGSFGHIGALNEIAKTLLAAR